MGVNTSTASAESNDSPHRYSKDQVSYPRPAGFNQLLNSDVGEREKKLGEKDSLFVRDSPKPNDAADAASDGEGQREDPRITAHEKNLDEMSIVSTLVGTDNGDDATSYAKCHVPFSPI